MMSQSTYNDGMTLAGAIKGMSDGDLLRQAATYNARLRIGRALVQSGQEMIDQNINQFVICKNELSHRADRQLAEATDAIK